jgi:Zn-dependent peptidase ImmA (M78 family)
MSKRNYVAGINHEIIRWAREKAGYSLEEVAQAFKKDVELIQAWESGDAAPTYTQLEKLAYQLYKRPTALFFFPSPPPETDPKQSFRTLPDFEIDKLSHDTRYALRQARAMQIGLAELNNGVNPSQQKIFRDLNVTKSDAERASQVVRSYLGISLDDQIRWKNKEDALENWREIVQDKGVFIFKRSYKQKDISGFSLVDPEFPVIYLNNSTAPSRQLFTIFHELGHVILNANGVTKSNDRYISSLVGDAKEIEIFCNKFAAEFLVPSYDLDQQMNLHEPLEQQIKRLADRYNVSREVILRKFLDKNLVSAAYYEEKARQWIEEYQKYAQLQKEKRKGKPSGDYYATQAVYLGYKYMTLAFNKYYEGRVSREQLADYLNVKVKNISQLENAFLGRS